MKINKKLFNGMVVAVVALTIGVVSSALANSLTVVNTNYTNFQWNGQDCVISASGGPGGSGSCKSFILKTFPVNHQIENLSDPNTGKGLLVGYFVDPLKKFPPARCSQMFNVNTSSAATITVQPGGAAFVCSISIQ